MCESKTSCAPVRHQRGAAALIVTMLLFFAMILAAVFVNRNLVFEQRTSANQYRSTQAFEAAEAGLEWALAQLNSNQRIGADCLPSADPAATSFRARYLSYSAAASTFAPLTWSNAGAATALQPSCVRSGGGWACSCPASGQAALDAPAGSGAAFAFTVQFQASTKPGVVRVAATGCTDLAGACRPGTTTSAGATARIEAVFGLFAGLRTPPAAALTTRGAVNADTAALGVHNADPESGIAIHAGAAIAASLVRLTPPAGASTAGSLVSNDAALAGQSADQLFASFFGIDKARWKNQPVVTRLSCGGCSAALADAIAAAGANPLLWIDGDLTLDGPLSLGSPQQPVVIVVNGAARLSGAVRLHGLIYSSALRWDATGGPGALLRGAAISETDYTGDAAPDLFYDRELLAALTGNTGTFTRVSGSWRDF